MDFPNIDSFDETRVGTPNANHVIVLGAGTVLLCIATIPLAVFPVRYVGRKILQRAQQLQSNLGSATSDANSPGSRL